MIAVQFTRTKMTPAGSLAVQAPGRSVRESPLPCGPAGGAPADTLVTAAPAAQEARVASLCPAHRCTGACTNPSVKSLKRP